MVPGAFLFPFGRLSGITRSRLIPISMRDSKIGWVFVGSEAVEVPSNVWIDCGQHASGVLGISGNRYEYLGTFNANKALRGLQIGKAAEWALYSLLSGSRRPVAPPDLTVYPNGEMGWSADLSGSCGSCGGSVEIHVKCWDSTNRNREGVPYEESYTFHVKDPVLGITPEDSGCPATHELWAGMERSGERSYRLRWLGKVDTLSHLVRLPRLERHQESKRCVYGYDLESISAHGSKTKRKGKNTNG